MHSISRSKILLDFYLFGFIICGYANYFLFELAPENWSVSISSGFARIATLLAWLLICSFCALSSLGLGYSLARIPKTYQAILALPFMYAIMEFARSYLFAIMAYGPHGKLSPNFNWGSVAVPASGTPLVFVSRLVGFFGLTIFVIVINICIYSLTTRYYRVRSFAALSVVFCLTYMSWSAGVHVTSPELTVKAVHVGSTQGLKDWNKASWPEAGTDLLVLPEYSEILKNPNYIEIMSRLSDTGLAVTTIRDKGSPEGTNRLIYINNKGEIVNHQDKTFLIPTGEYLPYSLQMTFRLIGKQKSSQDFKYTQQQTNGKIDEYPFSGGSFRVGALACSGVSALNEYKRLSREDADILVNSASLSFLAPRSHYHVYARNMARFHAVSNNKPFVQASRSGESYRITNQGVITYL